MTRKSERQLDSVTVLSQTAFLPAASPSIPKAGAPASVGDVRLQPTAPPGGSAWDGAGT